MALTEVPKDATFTCELSKPNRKVTWLKENKPIPIGKKYDIENVGCEYQLVVHDATVEDVGKFAMTCRNLKTQGSLTVESKC